MRIFEIKNTRDGAVYYVQHKENFCKEFGLTRRLLDRTFHQERNHHKGFVLTSRDVEFIPNEDGDKTIYGTNMRGHIVYTIDEPTIEDTFVDKYGEIVVEQQKTIDELKEKLKLAQASSDGSYVAQLEKKVQNLLDSNRVLRKYKREDVRTETVVGNFFEEVAELIPKIEPYSHNVAEAQDSDTHMVVLLSDAHFGKKIDMKSNKFNFEIAEKRLMKYADECIEIANDKCIDSVTVAVLGDMFHLHNKTDQLLTAEDTRAVSFVKGFDIVRKFYHRFLEEGLAVKTVGVLGNESRIREHEFSSNVDEVATDNFDYLLFNMLKPYFKDSVEFLNDCDTLSFMFNVNGKNIGITHGDKLKHDIEGVGKFKMRMLEEYREMCDYVCFGHIHSYLSTSQFTRSASLCGGDSYSSNALNIPNSVASQVVLLVGEDIRAMEIRL